MEFLAALLGNNWKAPKVEGGEAGGCSEAKREACLAEVGPEHIDWSCRNCPER
jgi:hypothetical protein